MKRVRVSPGKFVTVSQAMADKAARVFSTGVLTADQVRDLAKVDARAKSGVILGAAGVKSLKPVKPAAAVKLKVVRHAATGRIVGMAAASKGKAKTA